ncbi:uncharacterized protein Triagg1_4288 [Trichoderma aggressivum f. europaeum]|uniref:Uncharacterized protein n=1 Tax=Trichoderma aggressivum f. europaeum TaxID=173218 RepID=A0AAE1JBM9_9HYPO|nr:hypothetical protein Triagg1_4288 [Trichoderma aggressivum f. europaeum]
MTSTSNPLVRDLNYFVLSAANPAAIHLLSEIQSKSSPPTLHSGEETIGYRISIPSHNSRQDEVCYKWRVGAGPSPAIAKMGDIFVPEILLCPQDTSQTPSSKTVRAYIKHIHAVLFLHPQSGALKYARGQTAKSSLAFCGEGKTTSNSAHTVSFSSLPLAIKTEADSAKPSTDLFIIAIISSLASFLAQISKLSGTYGCIVKFRIHPHYRLEFTFTPGSRWQ